METIALYRIWTPPEPGETKGREKIVYGVPIDLTLESYDFGNSAQEEIISQETPENEVSTAVPASMPADNICPHCGAISFFTVEKCGICKKLAAKQKSEPIRKSKKQRLTFDQFEETKIYMNSLKRRWERLEFIDPPPPERAELEEEIERLDRLLEDNINLALNFDPKFFWRKMLLEREEKLDRLKILETPECDSLKADIEHLKQLLCS